MGFHFVVFLLKPLVHYVAMATPSQNPVTNALVCFKLSVSLSYLKFYCIFLWCGIFLEEVCIREGFKNSWCNRLRF